MTRIVRPPVVGLGPYWPDARRLWRSDSHRRKHARQFYDVRRSYQLGQLDIWLVWDEDGGRPDRGRWGRPQHAIGLILLRRNGEHLDVQFAAAEDLRQWIIRVVRLIEERARREGLNIRVYCRKGWLQELALLWAQPVTILRDPGGLHAPLSCNA